MVSSSTTRLDLKPIDLNGARQRVPNGRPALLAFWRSDCAPCLLELGHKAPFRQAAGRLRLFWVGLEPVTLAQQALSRWSIPGDDVYVATGDPAATLIAFGGVPPRLPLAVLVDGRGRVVDRHHGLLGADTIARWARRC